jgi:predicted polyphosphate/ATP-dependent NAD kinase
LKIGLIVNPVAGLGGRLAFKGTDGALAKLAVDRGAEMLAPARAARALAALAAIRPMPKLLAVGGAMGEDAALGAGLPLEVVHRPSGLTSSDDTMISAKQLLRMQPDLLLFAGGDGTARDIMAEVGQALPVLGIPAGVKMHSGVFARTPRDAGDLAAALIRQPRHARTYALAEVVDRDAEGVPELYGTMRVPRDPRRMQPAKCSPVSDDHAGLDSACQSLCSAAMEDVVTVIGPGSSTLRLKNMLSSGGTLLGADVYRAGRMIVRDADESAILAATLGHEARIVLGVIGGQGFLIGRGNQQISAEVIRRVGRANIVALSSAAKIAALPDRSLYADTGDEALDCEIAGYIPVQVSGARRLMMPLNAHLVSQQQAQERRR